MWKIIPKAGPSQKTDGSRTTAVSIDIMQPDRREPWLESLPVSLIDKPGFLLREATSPLFR